ncbi:hypothetical protein M408DRAFT_326062 [Serendipita vermifera MAFF 305830]|uniref:Formin GTPase-binding domain-containing protein n=1 Tax=Serendipita vermifera MAFF 305830 TaxID=933852 RepID=A0A0C2XWN7_SERVB|nr:hypothetical protein M408DRAFT_326062 [Serendipita vermifera MAFF 305830]
MFKGILKDPKRSSSQDTRPVNTSYIDALGNAPIGQAPLTYDPRTGLSQPQANKENRPTVRAELFLNLGSPGNGSPAKRHSALPPSVNLAMQNDNADDGGLPLNRGRSATVDNVVPNAPSPKKAKAGSSVLPGTSPVDPKGWGFEFVDMPAPQQEEDPVEKEKKTTNTDFDRMLDDLQIPPTLRPKLQGLDGPVKAAMIRSSHVLTIPPPSSAPVHPSASSVFATSPTKSKFGKDKDKKAGKDKDKFGTENFSSASPTKHAPNPFMFNRNGGNSGRTTPKKGGIRRTQSSGSLDNSPQGTLGTPYSQMPPGGGSPYNAKLGKGQEEALQFMFPSLENDPFSRSDSPPLMPPPTLAELQSGGYVGHLRSSSFDSNSGPGRLGASQSTLYLHGNGSGLGTSRGSASGGSGTGQKSWMGTGSSVGMTHGNQSRPRVGSGANGQAILVKSKEKEKEDKFATLKERERDWTPARFSAMLSQTKSTELEVERLKKLRIMLRNEAASWSEGFIIEGGYSSLLARLNEMLDVEWREEQRDDQILHELLRCFKALSTSSIGCFALRSSAPRPFVQLVSLLYSDKKPGDACSRILIVELLIILTELYPTVATSPLPPRPSSGLGLTTAPRLPEGTVPKSEYPLPAPHTSLFALLRAVLLTPKPLPSECPSLPISPHAFIESLHHARIYKAYLGEVADVCRDYFWVFCHPANGIWDMEAVDIAKVEAPRAPGGMTGGVEFEAMHYLTCHFKLLNAIGRAAAQLQLPSDHELSAARYHHDLFMSGIERIIAGARKASTVYYPTLHLEIARYVQSVRESGMELPYGLQRMVGLPPVTMCKPGYDTPTKPKAQPPNPGPATNHSRAASSAAVMGGGGPSSIKVGGGGYQGHQANLPKGAGAPVLPVPKFQ